MIIIDACRNTGQIVVDLHCVLIPRKAINNRLVNPKFLNHILKLHGTTNTFCKFVLQENF